MASIFVEIDGIKGSSTDEAHKEWMEIDSFNHSMELPFTGTRSGTGHAASGAVSIEKFEFEKSFDAASPKLVEMCVNGQNINKATVNLCRTVNKKQQVYMTWTLKHVVVASVSHSGSGDEEPNESFALNAAKWEWEYTPYDAKGAKKPAVKASWDVRKQQE